MAEGHRGDACSGLHSTWSVNRSVSACCRACRSCGEALAPTSCSVQGVTVVMMVLRLDQLRRRAPNECRGTLDNVDHLCPALQGCSCSGSRRCGHMTGGSGRRCTRPEREVRGVDHACTSARRAGGTPRTARGWCCMVRQRHTQRSCLRRRGWLLYMPAELRSRAGTADSRHSRRAAARPRVRRARPGAARGERRLRCGQRRGCCRAPRVAVCQCCRQVLGGGLLL
jgi:hypothetical protein